MRKSCISSKDGKKVGKHQVEQTSAANKSQPKNDRNRNNQSSQKTLSKFSLSLSKHSEDQQHKEQWKQSDIKKIFTLYFQFGSQWKLLETEFPQKSSNSIKNRFYTVVRTFLKILFRAHPLIKKRLPHEIPSKTILKFYEGRQEFSRFKGFGKKILKSVDYNLESKQLHKIARNNLDEILQIHSLIFGNSSNKANDSECSRMQQKIEDQKPEVQKEKEKDGADEKQLLKTGNDYQVQDIGKEGVKVSNSGPVTSTHLTDQQPVYGQSMNIMFVPTFSFVGVFGFHPSYF